MNAKTKTMRYSKLQFVTGLMMCALFAGAPSLRAWQADNGNGTFTNPLFYDEFSDPDLIRVGEDFYLTGTTMHTMPGLPVLHSKDLVNWELVSYACDKLDLGPEFRLEGGKEIYGQGIWAPSFRFHNGTFYIFSNVNHRKTQFFTATNPAGPWTHTELNRSFHDLSVLFDDDGKVYVVWGYQDIHFAQLADDLKDVVPGTERILFPKDAGMGEGSHFYKINRKYFITSAWFAGRMRMACARADKPEGPYEVNRAISMDEDFGLAEGNRLRNVRNAPPFDVIPANTMDGGRVSLHQGGLVQSPTGEWWGFAMMDYNSIGRLICLSPVTWQDGWPFFGLPGNLTRTPRTWTKPNPGHASPPSAPYQRNDDFSGPKLANVWQWNHVPDDMKWSLSERRGFLRLHSLPATNFWFARNTLTQPAIGPESIPTAELDASGMKLGDVAGLALLNFPYAWIGVRCETNGLTVEQFDQLTDETKSVPLPTNRVSLRAHCDFLTEKATFSYSTDGKKFKSLGGEFTMIFQGRTFQGVRYSLFNYNTGGAAGGYADFDKFSVDEPHPHGLMKPIPFGQTIAMTSVGDGSVLTVAGVTRFKVVDRELGRVALQSPQGFLSVDPTSAKIKLKEGKPSDTETFQWIETPYGDLILLSLATDRYLRIEPGSGIISANHPGPNPDRKDGSCFAWLASGK
jgi:xylan 1,4-beta-xylosidase